MDLIDRLKVGFAFWFIGLVIGIFIGRETK